MLDHRVCERSALVETAKQFSKVVASLSAPLTLCESCAVPRACQHLGLAVSQLGHCPV